MKQTLSQLLEKSRERVVKHYTPQGLYHFISVADYFGNINLEPFLGPFFSVHMGLHHDIEL